MSELIIAAQYIIGAIAIAETIYTVAEAWQMHRRERTPRD